MVLVSVFNIGGFEIWGPAETQPTQTVSDIKERILHSEEDPHCSVNLLLGSDVPKDTTALQDLGSLGEELLLTAVFEFGLTDKDRQDYIKQLSTGCQKLLHVFQQFPASARADSVVVHEAIRRDWQAIKYATGTCTGDKEFMRAAINANRRSLQFASPELRADQELVLEAASLNGYALQYADPSLSSDLAFMKELVRKNGAALEYASATVKSAKDVVLAAVRDNGLAVAFADAALKADTEVAMAAVSQSGHALQHLDASLQGNKPIVIAAVRQTGSAIKHVVQLKDDLDIRNAAFANGVRWR